MGEESCAGHEVTVDANSTQVAHAAETAADAIATRAASQSPQLEQQPAVEEAFSMARLLLAPALTVEATPSPERCKLLLQTASPLDRKIWSATTASWKSSLITYAAQAE